MAVYQALEILTDEKQPTGKYHYTRYDSDGVHAIGYCAHQCEGHDTKQEAIDHYRQWLLDTQLHLDGKTRSDEQRKCAICGGWTQNMAYIHDSPYFHSWPLCTHHCTKEFVGKLFTSLSSGLSN